MASLEKELQQRFAIQRHRLNLLERSSRIRTYHDDDHSDNEDLLCSNKSTWQTVKTYAACVRDTILFACSTRLFGLLLDVLLQLLFVLLVSSAVLIMGAFSVVMTELSRMYSRRRCRRSRRQKVSLMRRTVESTCLFVMAVLDHLDDEPVIFIPENLSMDVPNSDQHAQQDRVRCEGDCAPQIQTELAGVTEPSEETFSSVTETVPTRKDPPSPLPKPSTSQAIFSSVIGEIKRRTARK